jgi:HIV-1 Vpr-binding protein
MDTFYSLDPDPYDDRHPSRVYPSCGIGFLLKSFFKRELIVQDVFRSYLRENYWRTTQGDQERDSFELNVAASRLAIDILPGLQAGPASFARCLV